MSTISTAAANVRKTRVSIDDATFLKHLIEAARDNGDVEEFAKRCGTTAASVAAKLSTRRKELRQAYAVTLAAEDGAIVAEYDSNSDTTIIGIDGKVPNSGKFLYCWGNKPTKSGSRDIILSRMEIVDRDDATITVSGKADIVAGRNGLRCTVGIELPKLRDNRGENAGRDKDSRLSVSAVDDLINSLS